MDLKFTNALPVAPVPLMTLEKFATDAGLTMDQVRKYVQKDYLPTIRLASRGTKSKRVFVDLEALKTKMGEAK